MAGLTQEECAAIAVHTLGRDCAAIAVQALGRDTALVSLAVTVLLLMILCLVSITVGINSNADCPYCPQIAGTAASATDNSGTQPRITTGN